MKKSSKLLSLLLAILMIAGTLPFSALPVFATEAEPIVITAVSAQIQRPVKGAAVEYTAVVDSNCYTAIITRWHKSLLHNEEFPYSEEQRETFDGYITTAEVVFIPNDGYCFSENTIALINGKEAKLVGIGDSGRAYYHIAMAVEDPGKIRIDEVSISISEPTAGYLPDYTADIPENAHYSVASIIWRAGIYVADKDVALTEIETCEQGYVLTVEIAPEEGYSVYSDTNVIINGRKVKYENKGTYQIWFAPHVSIYKVNGEYLNDYNYSNTYCVDLKPCKVGEEVNVEFEVKGHTDRIISEEATNLPEGLYFSQISDDIFALRGTPTENAVGSHLFSVSVVWDMDGLHGYHPNAMRTLQCGIIIYDDNETAIELRNFDDEQIVGYDGIIPNFLVPYMQSDPRVIHEYYSSWNYFAFSVVDGELPPGMRAKFNSFYYSVNFSGTPTQEGTYTFTVEYVASRYNKEPLDSTVHTQTYTIVVRNPYHTITYSKGDYECDGILPEPVEVDDGVDYTLETTYPLTMENYEQTGWALLHENGWKEQMTVYEDDADATFVPVWTYNGPCLHTYCQKVLAKAATCTEDGNHLHYRCFECGELFANSGGTSPVTEAQAIIKAYGHDWREIIDIPATEEHTGLKHEVCDRCGETQNMNTVIPMIVVSNCENGIHDLVHHEYVAPTCKEYGSAEYWQCSECNKLYADDKGSEIWWRPTYLLPLGCRDANKDGYCDICGGWMPYYRKVTSQNEITSDGRYLIVDEASGKALTVPPIIVNEKTGSADFEYREIDLPTVDVEVSAYNTITDVNGAVAFKALQSYGDWLTLGGNTRYSMTGLVDGHMVSLADAGNQAYVDQESKYGNSIVLVGGEAKLVSGYEGDSAKYMYSYNIVGKPEKTYITVGDYDTVTDELGTRYYAFNSYYDEEANDGKGGWVHPEIENIHPVCLYREINISITTNNVGFGYSNAPSVIAGNTYGELDNNFFNGSDVTGELEALKPGEVEAMAGKADVNEGDLVEIGTEFTLTDYSETDGNGLMLLDISPSIFIGGTAYPIDSSSFNGREMTVTVWVGKAHPNQIICEKQDGSKEYFYRPGYEKAPENAKYFEVIPYEEGKEMLGEFITFTLTEFSSVELREVALPEIKGAFDQVNITLGSDITVHYYVVDNGYKAPRMRFEINSYTKTVDGVLGKDSKWQFSFDGVAPQWMGDTITAELLGDDGVTVIDTKDYSVLEYLNDLKTLPIEYFSTYSKEKYDAMLILINDLLVYGGASQTYVNHNTENLISDYADMNNTTVFTELSEKDTVKTFTNNGTYVTFNGMTLFFDNENKLIFRFTAENLTGVTFKVSVNGGAEKDIGYVQEGAYYVITTDGIKAVGFDDIYTVTAYKNNVPGATVTYSVKSYVYAKQNALTKVAVLVKATYNYGCSAKAFAEAPLAK